jgi:heme-degrading monooxygenase HmoA
MYARLTTIPVEGVRREQAPEFANEADQVLRQMDGFQSATYLMNDDITELTAFSVWETREHATAHQERLRQLITESMNEYLAGEPTTRIYEVYDEATFASAPGD